MNEPTVKDLYLFIPVLSGAESEKQPYSWWTDSKQLNGSSVGSMANLRADFTTNPALTQLFFIFKKSQTHWFADSCVFD